MVVAFIHQCWCTPILLRFKGACCRPNRVIMTPDAKVKTATLTALPESLPAIKLPTSVSGTGQVLLFDDWPKDGFLNDAAKITTVTFKKNTLKIQVVYQGGCQEHVFELYVWTGFLLSIPPQAELYLSHDAHGDACTENVEKLLSFDLTLFKRPDVPSAHPLLLRIYEPLGGSFANEPHMPLIEWP